MPMRQAKAAEGDVPTKVVANIAASASSSAELVPYWVWNGRMLKGAVITRQSCGL